MGTCASKCYPSSSSPPSTAGGSSLRGGSPAPNHHVQDALTVPVPADAAADYASPTPTTTTSATSLLSTTSSISMASSTVSSSSSATCSSPVFVKASPRLQGSKLEASCSWDVVVLDPNKLLSAITSSSNPRAVVRGPPLPRSPGRSKRARPVSPLPPRPAPGPPGCKKTCNSPKRTGKPPASGRQRQRVGRHRHSRVMIESRKSASSRGAMAAVGVGGGELVDDLNNPLISMDCFIFI